MEVFSAEEVERGRRYHRPRYLTALAGFVIGGAALAVLAFTDVGEALLPNWPWWTQALVYPTIVLAVVEALVLPLAFWRGYVHEHRWGLSTQDVRGWAADRAKGFAVGAAIATALFVGFFALTRALPDAWPLVVAPLAGAVVVFLTFIAPVVLEPIFNKFEPLRDEELANDLRRLAERAGVPVRDVLVADASRRTAKENAYVSGFGATRRVVIYDTMLQRSEPAELRAVLAHELAHRRYRDVLRLSSIGVLAAVALVVALWAILDDNARDPRSVPLVLLVFALSQPILIALLAAVARRWEYRADRFALLVTRDLRSLERMFRRLVESNVSDLQPPRVVYWLHFTHPTVPERIEALRRTAAEQEIKREEAA